MTDDAVDVGLVAPKANGTLRFFFIAGPILTLLGLIGGFIAKGAAESAASSRAFTAGYLAVLEGGSVADGNAAQSAVSPDYTGMIIFFVVGGVGLVLLIVGLAIRAAQPTVAHVPADN